MNGEDEDGLPLPVGAVDEGRRRLRRLEVADEATLPYPDPCRDCGREHVNGAHIRFFIPAVGGEPEVAWEGCVDCWLDRTNPQTLLQQQRTLYPRLRAVLPGHDDDGGVL